MKKAKIYIDGKEVGMVTDIDYTEKEEFENIPTVRDYFKYGKHVKKFSFSFRILKPKYKKMLSQIKEVSSGWVEDTADWLKKVVVLKELSIRTYLEKIGGYDMAKINRLPTVPRDMELSMILSKHKLVDVYNELTGDNIVYADGIEIFRFNPKGLEIRHIEFKKKNFWRLRKIKKEG